MSTTILNKIDAELLETIIFKFGDLVTVSQIYTQFEKEYTRTYLQRFIERMVSREWFVRLKRGQYLVTNLETRGYIGVSQYFIANSLLADSYVSFGLALQYYGMFDQMLSTVTSISLKQHRSITIQETRYRYISTDKKYFYGWDTVKLGNNNIRVASKEKALIDILQFHRNIVSVDLVIEKVLNHKNEINNSLIIKYANLSTVSVQRLLGFILDIAELATEGLIVNNSAIKMTSESDQFNARWRLYYEKHFNQYLNK